MSPNLPHFEPSNPTLAFRFPRSLQRIVDIDCECGAQSFYLET